MAHDHSYDCRQCGAHLDSQEELNRHIRENHSAQAGQQSRGSSQSQSSNPSNPSNPSSRRPDDSGRL